MIDDFRTLNDRIALDCDVCIIGGGAAGITAAMTLMNTPAKVILLESGGLTYDAATQALYEGKNVGENYFRLDTCRVRFLGGTTNHWGGMMAAPLDAIDFQERPWIQHSGWPIDKADLTVFYQEAQSLCELGPFVYDEQVWKVIGIEPPALDAAKVRTRFWQHSRSSLAFGVVYREKLKRAQNLQVLLHANVTNLELNAAATAMKHVEVRSLAGTSATVRARYYILSCGGIENARLLLASDGVQRGGVGNQNDLVGRYFMEHPGGRGGIMVTDNPVEVLGLFRKHIAKNGSYTAGLCLSDEWQTKEQILNCVLGVRYIPEPNSGTEAARSIWRDVKDGRVPDDLVDKMIASLRDLDDVTRNAYRRFAHGQEPISNPQSIFLHASTEQSPNPNSRVTLIQSRDALGVNQSQLNWQLLRIDKQTIKITVRRVTEELARLNLARVKVDDWLLDDTNEWTWGPGEGGGYHHMGTTRMANLPEQGVVDSDCKVHGLDNLYIAGSSVFPTSGFANPTLTIVALALRLARQLQSRLA